MTTFPARSTGTTAGRPPRTSGARPVSAWAFAGVAVTSFGGPLALAALNAPGIVAGSAGASAGLAMVAAVAVFAFPLVIWLRYSRQVNGAGGLYAFVEAAPLAADPAITRAPIPGMAVAERFAGHGFAVTVGIGVAVSIAGVMLVEYLALSRLVSAVVSWPMRRIIIAIGAAIVLAAPLLSRRS